jgi:N-acetylneuraminic acid mutarotase
MRTQRLLLSCLCGCLLGFVGLCSLAGAQTAAPGEWTWMGGSSTVPGQFGVPPGAYGTLGIPAPGNTPGGREYALNWTDNNGHLWLFGGLTFSTQLSYFNDLWKFDPATSEWAWISGSSSVGSNCPVLSSIANCGRSGTYGTLGLPSAGNTPGGRYQSATWVDLNGNFWLYGGEGFDVNGNWGALSDLWRFNPSTNMWAWMGGNSTVPVNPGCNGCILGQPPVPGTLGVPAAGNTPGGLWLASNWTDSNGNLWLFGGWGYNTNGNGGVPNDLWQFNPLTNEWAWMGGSSTFGSDGRVLGTYGALGKPASGNIPGSRWSGATWIDPNGNLWLFGGQGSDATGMEGILNDLWEFNPSTNQWAWMGGSSTLNCADVPQKYCNQPGVYGTLGIPAVANIPGSRAFPFNWRDSDGNLWLFGGQGFDANSNYLSLNDLWVFSPAKNVWAWMGGLSAGGLAPSGAGIYGTLGAAAAGNQPGRRSAGLSWTDKRGYFWLWGGFGLDASSTVGYLNDLWVYQPSSTSPFAPSFTVSGTAASVARGATTTSTVTVTPTGGFTGNVTLTAALTPNQSGSVIPPFFSFNSTTPVSITGNAPDTAVLTIVATSSVSSTCTSSNQIPNGISWYAGSGAALAGLFLFVIPKRGRTLRSILSLILAFIALHGGMVGCSGGGHPAPCPVVPAGTSAGTYIITVTGTSGSIIKTGTVSLTVQ